ncbi:unnamed protein product [Alternaria alternata]
MATNRCQQILMAADNDITVAAYNIFCECQSNENIKAQNWEELIASLGEEDKKKFGRHSPKLDTGVDGQCTLCKFGGIGQVAQEMRGVCLECFETREEAMAVMGLRIARRAYGFFSM